uniref:Uncharacterized protein n=1 Tax=Rhizophora mucronata TaxID=61149 RepID=A0A2P2NGM2_RHIMU
MRPQFLMVRSIWLHQGFILCVSSTQSCYLEASGDKFHVCNTGTNYSEYNNLLLDLVVPASVEIL